MQRDIVQFVPFSECKNDEFLLAKTLLAELPRQVTDYFLNANIFPQTQEEVKQEAQK